MNAVAKDRPGRAFRNYLIPSTDIEPLPHLASITYFRSPPEQTCSPPHSRPVHPTPRRMLSQGPSQQHSTILPRQRRPPSVSAIPRPTSGSSRQATPVAINAFSKTSADSGTTTKPNEHAQGSYQQPGSRHTSSSFSMQRAIPPRVDSLPPHTQRTPASKLSAFHQQLHIRNYSTQSLASLDVLSQSSNSPAASPPMFKALPKSKTSTSLAQRVRDLTPQRQLMQPLGPPMPRVQTIGNLSCFNGAGLEATPSPVKSSPLRSDEVSFKTSSSGQVEVNDALLESRMTDHEIEVLKQIEKETQANLWRLRNTLGDPLSPPRLRSHFPTSSSSSFLRRSDTSVTLNLSANDIVNSRKLEEQRYRRVTAGTSKVRNLFINSTVANIAPIDSPLPTPVSIQSKSSDEWEVNLKHVHFAESLGYWTGRYVAVYDRLRNEDLSTNISKFAAAARHQGSPTAEDKAYDFAEYKRMKNALDELRSCCRTEKALKSFEKFETQLRKKRENNMVRPDTARRQKSLDGSMYAQIQASRAKVLAAGIMPKNGWFGASTTEASSSTNRNTSIGTMEGLTYAQPVIVGSKTVRPSLPKSKTTGNLARPELADPIAAEASHYPRAANLRAGLNLEQRAQVNAKVLKEREERANRRADEARRRSSTKNTADSSWVEVEAKGMRPLPTAVDTCMHRGLQGEGKQSEPRNKTRTRSGRQSSGEMLKSVLESGILGIRRMGRRVTGGGVGVGSELGESSDDLRMT